MLDQQPADPFGLGPASQRSATWLGTWQAGFATALLDPERPIPAGLVGPAGRPPARRFHVYRNNVVAGLVATLKDAYPAVTHLVGDEFFAAMARTYVVAELPTSPIMLHYGAGFPDFLDRFEPVQGLPYLCDVAHIERAWLESYHAAEAQALGPAAFADVATEDLPNLRLALHPSLRLVRSSYPALTIWRMCIETGVPAPIDLGAGGEDVLALRAEAEVELRLLPPGGAAFVQALADGRSVLMATAAAMSGDPRFDLTASLSELIGMGACIGFEVEADAVPRPLARQA